MRVIRFLAAVLLAAILTVPVLLVALFANEEQLERFRFWLVYRGEKIIGSKA